MKKLGVVLGVAAIAAISGCRDPEFDGGANGPDNTATVIPSGSSSGAASGASSSASAGSAAGSYAGGSAAVTPVAAAPVAPIAVTAVADPVNGCKCPAGTVHTSPCTCNAPDCTCTVSPKAGATGAAAGVAAGAAGATGAAVGAAAAETTTYIVQRGDSLSKISKRFNIKTDAIVRLNNLKDANSIRIGQKIKLPGKVEVGEQKVPEGAIAKPVAKAYAPYSGATKEYVVKGGDSLSAIAFSNGISTRQLKELNALSSDMIRVGQKLKVPAEKVVSAAAPKAAAPKAAAPAKAASAPAKPVAASASAPAEPVNDAAPASAPVAPESDAATSAPADAVEAPADAAAPAAAATTTYTVLEGDDMTSVAIDFGVTAAVIREMNGMGDNDQLKPGQVIKLPADRK